MPIMLIVKAIAGAAVLCAVGSTAYLIKDFTGTVSEIPTSMNERQKQVELALKQKTEELVLTDNQPGEKAFRRVKQLLANGNMKKAEQQLKYVISNYPTAESAIHARRILGEINLDRILDPRNKKGKVEVTVKSGDTFTRIIKNNKTTMDSLVHHSQLMRKDHRSIHPGDKLTIMPLNMRAVINVRRKTMTLHSGDEFVKEYIILKQSYTGSGVKKAKITSIRGHKDGRSYLPYTDGYRSASKTVILSEQSLMLRADGVDTEDDFSSGFTLSRADMEELPLLLRPGNEVEIR